MSLAKACLFMGFSRQSYYQQIKAEASVKIRDAQVAELVLQIRRRQPRLGGRKLYFLLHEPMLAAGIKLGRDGLFATLRRTQLLVPPLRAYHKTTNSFHHLHKHPI